MSAIVGIFYRNGNTVKRETLSRMLTALQHRGGDDYGTWFKASLALGQQTQWITPESINEKLPIWDSDAQVSIVADARLDNREELFDRLAIPRDRQDAVGDGELILISYLKWGKTCLEHLFGDFAFAIWDDKQQQLFLAKDHIGICNLYYYIDASLIAFASEIKALFELEELSRKLDRQEFLRCFYGHIIGTPSESTFFQDIHSLQGGKYCLVTPDSFQKARYWHCKQFPMLKLKSEAEYLEAYKEVFQQAVVCRMRSHYPVGSLLSGGLDSSSIVAVAANHLAGEGKKLDVFSHVMPENNTSPYQDERQYIEIMRKSFALNVHYFDTTQCDAFKDLDQVFSQIEFPLIGSRVYVFDCAMKMAQDKGIRVMLDGVGGELTSTSYAIGLHADLARRGNWLKLLRLLRSQAKVEGVSVKRLAYFYLFKPHIPRFLYQRYINKKHGLAFLLSHSPLRAKHIYARASHPSKLFSALEPSFERFATSFKQKFNRDLNIIQVCNTGLEERYPVRFCFPFLDKRVIEFMYSLPDELRIKKGWTRYIGRAGLSGLLPDEICWRKDKKPFSPAHEAILRNSDTSARSILKQAEQRPNITDILDVEKISANWRKFAGRNSETFSYQFDPFYEVAAAQFLLSFEKAI